MTLTDFVAQKMNIKCLFLSKECSEYHERTFKLNKHYEMVQANSVLFWVARVGVVQTDNRRANIRNKSLRT